MDYLWVGLGGFLGANARYALGTWIVQRAGPAFPWHTLLINVTGSLAIGVILLTAGIIGLVTGRRRTPVTAGPAGYPDVPPPGQAPGQQPPPSGGQTPAGASYPPMATGPDIDPTPTEPFPRNPHDPPTQASDPEFNRPGG